MAKTSLARQLDLLKTPQSSAHRETKGAVSLLYDFFDAKSIDSNTHFSVALDGLEGLMKLDYSLARYKESLFHESSKGLDRSIMSKEDNEKLDGLLEEYLFTVVSKYFQITDTMKTLEWLVYRYKIHLYNVDAYVGSVLPYHGTRQFARVLQTVSKIKDPSSVRWHWLMQIQMKAVPLSMTVLVQHCSANHDFFRYITDQIFKAVIVDENNVRFASFFVVFCVKMLEHSKSEEVVAMILSGLSKSLRKNKPLFYSPACIVLSHLTSLVQLEVSVLMKLLKLFAPRYTQSSAHKTFLSFNIIAKTQDLVHFPEEFLSGIILQELFDWIAKNRNCDSLINLLFGTIVHFAGDERLEREAVLENVEKMLSMKAIMKKQTIHSIVRTINEALEKQSEQERDDNQDEEMEGKEDNGDEDEKKRKASEALFTQLIRHIEKYYPLALDSAIAELESSVRISELLNAFRFSQVEKYNVPLFVGLDHSSNKVRRKSLLHLVHNFKHYITESETDYIRSILKRKFFENFESTSVDILLEIFSIKMEIFNLFSADEFQKIAFKLVNYCEQNLSAKREDENAMEVDVEDAENLKWFELKKCLLETFFSKKFQDYYIEDPHYIAQSLFFATEQRFQLSNFLFPSNQSQYEIYALLLSSPFGKSHPFMKTIKDKTADKKTGKKKNGEGETVDLDEICSRNFESIVKFIQQNLDIVLDKESLKKAMASTLQKNSDSYRRSLILLSMALSKIFHEDKSKQEVVGSTILDSIRFFISNFEMTRVSKKTKLEMFEESSGDCFSTCLRQNGFYECSTVSATTLIYILHEMINGYHFVMKNQWSMVQNNDPQQGDLIAYKLYKILMFLSCERNCEFSPSKHTFYLFQQLFELFLTKIVYTQKDIFSFFMPILVSESLQSFRLETLSLLNGLIEKEELSQRFVDSLAGERKTMICHLLALASSQQECRQSVIKNLEVLHQKLDPKKDSSLFLTELFASKNKLLLDHKVLMKSFGKIHRSTGKSQKYVGHLVNDLLEAFFSNLLPVECRCLVIALFADFEDSTRESLFKHFYGALGDFDKLTSAQEKELQSILAYYYYSTDLLFHRSDSFSVKFYLKVLKAAETSLSSDCCVVIFRAFEQSFRTMVEQNADLTMKIALNMLEMELRLSESGLSNRRVNHMKLISWLRKSVSTVVCNGFFTAELMKNILNVEEASTSIAALLKDAPSKKKSKLDSVELAGKYLRSWKLLRILVGCIQTNKTFTNPSILVKSLFNYFNAALTEICDPSIVEHTRQVILYAISHLIEIVLETNSRALEDERKRQGGDEVDGKDARPKQNGISSNRKSVKKPAKVTKQDEEKRKFLEQIDIDSIVHCLSESRYQDTQRIALLSLSLLSSHFHEQILKSLVAIFGFIGTSLLQCDDQYSLAILYETIESIIPMVLENSGDKAEERRHYILSIFLDYLKNIPSYRRLVLFTKLIHLLGEEKFLPFFTVSLYEKKYLQFESTKKNERDSINRLAFSIFQAFPIGTQIRSACALLSVFESEFFEIIFTKVNLIFDRKSVKKLEANNVAKEFKMKLKTEERQLACGVDLLKFISELVSNPEFRFAVNNLFVKREETPIDDMEELESVDEKEARLKHEEGVKDAHLQALTYFFHLLIEMIVSLGPKEAQTRSNSFQFRRRVRDMLDDILSNFNQLFPPTEILDLIIDKMLKNSYNVDKQLFVFVQRRALRLMYEKLSALDAREISRAKALQLLDSLLIQLPVSIKSIEKNREQIHNVQNLMLAFKACFKFVNDTDPKEENEMKLLTVLLKKILTFTESIHIEKKRSVEVDDKSLSNIKGSCLICLVKVLCSMTADGIEHLGQVMSLLLNNFGNDDEVVLISNICAVSNVMSKFGQFLSPYMSKIILALLPAFNISEQDLGVRSRLQFAWNMMSKDVPKRVLFDAISHAYQGATKISPQATIELFGLLKKSCINLEETEILLKSFRELMLNSMKYRGDFIKSVELKTIEQVETSIGEAFSAFFPKLNESQFRPLFYKLHSSALETENQKEDNGEEDGVYYSLKKDACYKMIAFYRFCSQLADSLKSLFCVFVAPAIVKNASEMLVAYHSQNTDEDKDDEEDERLHKLAEGSKLRIVDPSIGEPLVSAVLSTFSKCFLFDLSGSFVRDDSVNTIVKPLIHQISNVSGSNDDYQRRVELILQCTQYLIQNNKDETLIKEFNYQILLKTRESHEKIRIAAIRVLHRLILTCAEEYLSFIPEAIPYISEMCEDHSDAVDTHLKKLIIDIEQLVGEPIKKYL